ncbi:MAG: xanthine dehydrogenase small subunit [Gammaproteobacteria bacterium]|nr:xanthine dehydrogenase small subunit [Gammaproteobacteria bacterium]MDH5322390.1 xanthine dehydrogenase small subunit [Gammaproteobacteria bacterium]
MGSTVKFVLDGEVIELANVDPTRTVLQLLREDLRRTGTKEGCAEGDCGACTVVIAELNRDSDGLQLKAINSCIQFVPTLHGRQLITVESLQRKNAGLHPVQQALVDCHGSQCGFCTPGFAMSLFALYKSNPRPSRTEIDDALAGNLCRCTGYRPIIAAANAMYELPPAASEPLHAATLAQLEVSDSLHIEHGARNFFAPTTREELAALLAKYPRATLLAGGTDVGLWVTKQHRVLDTVIYTARVAGLQQIAVSRTHIEIGAAVSLAAAMEAIVAHYPALDDLFRRFASPPIRNAGTLGGNIANGSPIGDSMPALMVAGTTLTLMSAAGEREIALEDFYLDYQVKDLKAGEFLAQIRIPLPEKNVVLHSHKLSKRFDQDISAVCSAYRLQLDAGRVASFAMACGGMAATIRRARHCEAALNGQPWTAASIDKAMLALAEDFAPISDMRSSAAYRLRAAQNMLRRFFLETSGELESSVYRYGR